MDWIHITSLTKCIDIQIDYDIEKTFYQILSGVRAPTLEITISTIKMMQNTISLTYINTHPVITALNSIGQW